MERDIRATAHVDIPFTQARDLVLADPAAIVAAGGASPAGTRFSVDPLEPSREPGALVLPLRIRPLVGSSLRALDADLRFEGDEVGTRLELLGR